MSQAHKQFRDIFERTESLSADRLRDYQIANLDVLCRHARAHVPFYRDRLAPVFDSQDRFRIENWDNIPLLSRADVLTHFEALKSDTLPQNHGETSICHSSGSSGQPIRVLQTTLNETAFGSTTDRIARWHTWDPRGRSGTITDRGPRIGVSKDGERSTFADPFCQAMGIEGCSRMLSSRVPLDWQADWLDAFQPQFLRIYPANLRLLLDDYDRSGRSTPTSPTIMTAGEACPDDLRVRCENLFAAKHINVYGAREIGRIAIQAPNSRALVCMDELVKAEIIDADGRGLGDGETGDLVFTPVLNFAMPLIRYAIGDRGCFAAPDQFLPHTMFETIAGRSRAYFTKPDGTRFWPGLSPSNFYGILGTSDYQVVQSEPRKIEIHFVPCLKAVTESDRRDMQNCAMEAFGDVFEIALVERQAIPFLPNGKRPDFINRLETP